MLARELKKLKQKLKIHSKSQQSCNKTTLNNSHKLLLLLLLLFYIDRK